jgi:4-carboxymuconolactone decarboxylase
VSDGPKRFEEPDPAAMDADLREFHDRLSQHRGKLPGPYRVWLEHPAFARVMEPVSTFHRVDSVVPKILREVAIITTVRHWRAQYAWHSHAKSAAAAGVPDAAIAAIRDRRTPDFDDEKMAAVHTFCRENLEEHAVSDATWERAVAAVGRKGVIELIGLMAHYCAVSFTLNSYGIPPADGAAPELKD